MASKKATLHIKGIKDNSWVKEIGSVYRRLGGSDWRINIKLDPGQSKKSFSISQLTAMPRRRVLNATKDHKLAGYPRTAKVDDTSTWSHRRIRECPIRNVSEQEDRDQWCFSFESGGIEFFLPQIELARALFFHNAYMTRLAMIPNGLNEEFDIQSGDDPDKAEIHILPTSTLPLNARGDHEQRRVLAWVLLDREARQSFSSIAQHQMREAEERNGYRHWRFRFDPPPLSNVELMVRGHFQKGIQTFFVYEIYSVENLTVQSSAMVEFFDPRFIEQKEGNGGSLQGVPALANQPLIDDEEPPSLESGEHILDVPPVNLSFTRPVMTVRKATSGRRRSGAKNPETASEPGEGQLEVSTDEPTLHGDIPAGGFDAVDDQSNESHLYTRNFEAFSTVIELLENKGCRLLFGGIRKLPVLKGYSKHLLSDGNPRCLSYRVLNYESRNYALLEVDTSDINKGLSTLLLKQPRPDFAWQATLVELEQRLIKKSLRWPTTYLDETFPGAYKRISHHGMQAREMMTGKAAYQDVKAIRYWSERILAALE